MELEDNLLKYYKLKETLRGNFQSSLPPYSMDFKNLLLNLIKSVNNYLKTRQWY